MIPKIKDLAKKQREIATPRTKRVREDTRLELQYNTRTQSQKQHNANGRNAVEGAHTCGTRMKHANSKKAVPRTAKEKAKEKVKEKEKGIRETDPTNSL
jgi:hypothetical protein